MYILGGGVYGSLGRLLLRLEREVEFVITLKNLCKNLCAFLQGKGPLPYLYLKGDHDLQKVKYITELAFFINHVASTPTGKFS